MNDDDIRDALNRAAPHPTVPAGLLRGALRRRRRTRGLVAAGALALAGALIVPLALNLGNGAGPVAEPASAPVTDAVAEVAESAQPPAEESATDTEATPEAASGEESVTVSPEFAATRSLELGWDVIQAADGPNRVVSPSSLSMSLVQAAEGAEGASLASIDDTLGLTGDSRAASFAALREQLLPYDSLPASVDADDPPETPVVHQASRVLAIDSELKQPFLERIALFYDAQAESTTFDDAKANLDAWATKHTAGLIEQSAIEPKPDLVAVLQDALLFAAAWRDEFRYEQPISFTTPAGPKTVEGVSDILPVAHAEGERWTAVRLPYDDNLAADVILPTAGVAPEDLTVEELEAARAALDAAEPAPINVTMPTFDLTAKTDLLNALPQLDLSNLNGIFDGGFAGQWVQQTKLIVTAQGTVGAALTEMAVFTSSGGSAEREFIVDRPYVFRVSDTRTGWPLFVAAISDPSEES